MWDYNMRNGPKSVFVVEKEWDPATARWEIPWTSEGGDFDESKPIAHSSSDTTVKRWEIFDVTETAKQFVQNPASNFGFLIRFDDDDRRGIMVYSSESPETDKRPKLVINGDGTHIKKVKNNRISGLSIFTQGTDLWVRVPITNGSGKINVYSIEGKKIASVSVNAQKEVYRIAQKLTPGTYFIRLVNNSNVIIKKGVIIR